MEEKKKRNAFKALIVAGAISLVGCAPNTPEIKDSINNIQSMGIEDPDVIEAIHNFLKTGTIGPLERKGSLKLNQNSEEILQEAIDHVNDTIIEGTQQSTLEYDSVTYQEEKKTLRLGGNRKNDLEISVEDKDGILHRLLEKREQAKILIETYDQILPMRATDDKVGEIINIITEVANLTNQYDLVWEQGKLLVRMNEEGKERVREEEVKKEMGLE